MKCFPYLFSFLPCVLGAIRGINIYGLETDLKNCQCSYKNGCEYYMEYNVGLGFNFFRIPFSAEYVRAGDFSVLDGIIDTATRLNSTIMLDYHRTFNSHQGNWYETTLNNFLSIWNVLLLRYFDKPIVQYIDLYNEFQDGQEKTDFWNQVMTDTVLSLETQYPKRYNWVIGGTNWGGNLHGNHIDLPFSNIYYTIHKYEFSKLDNDYRKDWDFSFGFVPADRLIVGEFGWKSDQPEQVFWAQHFLAYLKENGFHNTIFWTLALSGDTGGILRDDCLTLETDKLIMLRNFWDLPARHLRIRMADFFIKNNIPNISKE